MKIKVTLMALFMTMLITVGAEEKKDETILKTPVIIEVNEEKLEIESWMLDEKFWVNTTDSTNCKNCEKNCEKK